MRRYLLTNVASCTITFSDGLKSKVTSSPENEFVLLKIIPRTSKHEWFESNVLANISSARNINELAKLCGYDCERTFTRHFKKTFGETPYQWMLNKKMDEVHSLVINTTMNISDIATIYGFKSVSHLTNLYTKRYGISPSKSRSS